MQVYASQHLLLQLLPSSDIQKLQGQNSMHSMKGIQLATYVENL